MHPLCRTLLLSLCLLDRPSLRRADWRSVALCPLEVAPGVTPRVPALFDLPLSACRDPAPSDSPSEGKKTHSRPKVPPLLLIDGEGGLMAAELTAVGDRLGKLVQMDCALHSS